MDFGQLARSFQALWEAKPGAIVLLFLGFAVFLYLVVDTWRHKRHRRKSRPQTLHVKKWRP